MTLSPILVLSGIAFLQTIVAALVLTPAARALAPRLGMVDKPTLDRKIHDRPIPRAGGLAIYAAFWGCLLADLLIASHVVPELSWLPDRIRVLAANVDLKLSQLGGVAAGALVIFALGVADDALNLSPKLRLVVQFIATLPLIATGVSVTLFFLPDWMGWIVTALWVVLLTNSFNFLDNMNGLTAGVSVIIALVLALASWMSGEYYMLLLFMMLAGAALGFWFFNFPKASIFLGDSGSTHLGFLFGALTVIATYYRADVPTTLPILMPVLALGVPLFDTLSVMWIRFRTGKPLMEGDRNHFSHRLVALGMTHVQAVAFIYGVTLVVGLAAVVLRVLDWKYALVQAIVIGLMFVGIHKLERIGGSLNSNSE